MNRPAARDAASFRDPKGFVFWRDGRPCRQINGAGAGDYHAARNSGLLGDLERDGLMVATEEVDLSWSPNGLAAVILSPEPIPFISHPYEWSFGMLKDAALLTLDIQERALERGFILKDASAFNVQFLRGRPVFIDTLSLEPYRKGEPWIAYGQFCRHFLAPLALMSLKDVRLGELMGSSLDGIPLDLASKLLPGSSKFNPGLLMHLHLHSSAKSHEGGGSGSGSASVSEAGLKGIVQSLKSTITKLNWEPKGTEWAEYYSDTNYSSEAFADKRAVIGEWLGRIAPNARICFDLGANNGSFSRLAADSGIPTIAADMDPAAVEQAYRHVRKAKEENIHPLLLDLRSPSPARGWMNKERPGILERAPGDVALALALVHHLAIGNNVPLPMVWEALARFGKQIIVEWVPKADSQVQRLLNAREDVFDEYREDCFTASIPAGARVVERRQIKDSGRVLYWVEAA